MFLLCPDPPAAPHFTQCKIKTIQRPVNPHMTALTSWLPLLSAPATLGSGRFCKSTPSPLRPQGLCTCCSSCLEYSSPSYQHSILLHFLQVYGQGYPLQEASMTTLHTHTCTLMSTHAYTTHMCMASWVGWLLIAAGEGTSFSTLQGSPRP